jgi:hypothetical protein
MNWIPLAFNFVGNAGFSEACPHPGHTAKVKESNERNRME